MKKFLLIGMMAVALCNKSKPQEPTTDRPFVMETAAEARKESFFSYEERMVYSTATIPKNVLSADDPNREVVVGGAHTPVEIYLFGADPSADYEIELTFLSDTKDRVVTVGTDQRVLEEKIALPYGKPLIRRWTLPRESYKSGHIFVEVRAIAGPNAPVSAMKLFCSSSTARPLVPDPPKPLILVTAGRITPNPASLSGIQTSTLSLCGTWRFNPSADGEFWKETAFPASTWKQIEVPGTWFMQGYTVESGKSAGYQRDFVVPKDWSGQRIKLRCDGVYSDSRVWINGRRGWHAHRWDHPF